MKTLTGMIMIVFFGVFAQAQDAPRAATGFSISTEKIVKNSPFTAEAVSESVQTLADGNRILNKSTSKLYRNSEGRFRREMPNGSGGLFGSFYSYEPNVTILDPVVGQKFLLDSKLATATASPFKTLPDFQVRSDMTEEQRKAVEEKLTALKANADDLQQKAAAIEKLKGELRVNVVPMAPLAPMRPMDGQLTGVMSIAGGGNVSVFAPGMHTKYDSKTEELGTQNFDGIDAEGTRTTTTIPAGAIGNERPIEITYERWFSKELQLVVMSKHNDPRSGEQTYKLTNIVRTEPDPSLFALPSGYKVFTAPAAGAYTVFSPAAKADAERTARPVTVATPSTKAANVSTPAAKAVTAPAPAAKPDQQ